MTSIAISSKEIRALTTATAVNVCEDSDGAFGIVLSVGLSQNQDYDTINTALDLADIFLDRISNSTNPIKLEERNGIDSIVYVFGEAIRLVSDPEYFEEFQRLSAYETAIVIGISLVEE